MEPIPWQIKLLFHIFGCASAILGIIQISYVVQGTESCVSTFTSMIIIITSYSL